MSALESPPTPGARSKRKRHLAARCGGLGIVLSILSGCHSYQNCYPHKIVDDAFCAYRDHVWAKRAFHLRYPTCSCAHPSHFRRGFIAGYEAICDGGDAYIPAMPPKTYWGYAYQSADGQQMVESWFSGYPEGVRAAQEDGAGTYRDIHLSNMIQEALDSDPSVWDEYADPLPPMSGTEIEPEPMFPAFPEAPPQGTTGGLPIPAASFAPPAGPSAATALPLPSPAAW